MSKQLDEHKITLDADLVLLSKREALLIVTLTNESDTMYAKVNLKGITIGGLPITVASSKAIRNFKPSESADLEAQLVLPSNAPFDFNDEQLVAESEMSFDVYPYLSKQGYDNLPEWRT